MSSISCRCAKMRFPTRSYNEIRRLPFANICCRSRSGLHCVSRSRLHCISLGQDRGSGSGDYGKQTVLLTDVSVPIGQQRRCISQEIYTEFLSPLFPPIGCAKTVLETVHSLTGLPWWASIALTTITLRTLVTLPLMIFSLNVTAKIELLQPEIKQLSQELTNEIKLAQAKFQWSQKLALYHYKINVCCILINIGTCEQV